jgi:hypothetical protein
MTSRRVKVSPMLFTVWLRTCLPVSNKGNVRGEVELHGVMDVLVHNFFHIYPSSSTPASVNGRRTARSNRHSHLHFFTLSAPFLALSYRMSLSICARLWVLDKVRVPGCADYYETAQGTNVCLVYCCSLVLNLDGLYR